MPEREQVTALTGQIQPYKTGVVVTATPAANFVPVKVSLKRGFAPQCNGLFCNASLSC